MSTHVLLTFWCENVKMGSNSDNVLFFYFYFLVYEGREDSAGHHRPPVKRHLNGVWLACRCWPNSEFWLASFGVFQGIRTSMLRNPIFVIFQGKPGPPVPL